MVSVVVVGRLNPLIFQPEWLRTNKIIGQTEADEAREGGIELLHRDVTILNLSSMKLLVDGSRFSISVLEEPFVRAKDFAMNCFALLPHTPVRALGMNTATTVRYSNLDAWHRLGDILAPKDHWNALLGQDDRTGGLRTMTMERSTRPDGLPGYVRVTVEALETSHRDTKITVNDHFALTSDEHPVHASEILKMLDEHWDLSIARSVTIGNEIMGLSNDQY